MNFNPFRIIKLLLGLFICIGLGLTIFMIVQSIKVTGAYMVSELIVIFPSIILYGLTNGEAISIPSTLVYDEAIIYLRRQKIDLTQLLYWST